MKKRLSKLLTPYRYLDKILDNNFEIYLVNGELFLDTVLILFRVLFC